MLPDNHRVTEIISKPTLSTCDTPEYRSYLKTLTADQKMELDRVIWYHQVITRNAQHPTQAASATRAPLNPRPTSQQTQNQEIHVHVHHHNQRDYWYDWWIWNCMMNSSRSYYVPTSEVNRRRNPQHENRAQQQENNAAVVILATLVIGCAVVASLYVAIEAGRCFDQLAYAEDVLGNMTRLAMTAFGGSLGMAGGLMFGSAVLGMPILSAVCGMLILAGLAIAASKKIVEAAHQSSNYDSALAYDPRFCLSNKEKTDLESKGYDAFAVSEALRAVAISYDKAHKEASTLMFWSKDNKEKAVLIDLVRELKQGLISPQFNFGEQLFDLMKPSIPMPAPPPPINPAYKQPYSF